PTVGTKRTVLVPASGEVERYSLEGTDNELFLKLANTPCTVEGVQDFLSNWGPLLGGYTQDIEIICEEMIQSLRQTVLSTARGKGEARANPSVQLILHRRQVGRQSTPRLSLDALDLYDFCIAQ